jgi:hypothetical protein
MVTIGASGRFDANLAAVNLAAAHDAIHATVGVHPHEAASVDDAAIDTLAALAARPKVVAIGETGLDYHYEHSPRPAQREAFARFIQLARRLALPVVVHLREADDDAVAVMRAEHASDTGGVIHCFSGDAAGARRFLDLGFHISFSGIVTFKTADALARGGAPVSVARRSADGGNRTRQISRADPTAAAATSRRWSYRPPPSSPRCAARPWRRSRRPRRRTRGGCSGSSAVHPRDGSGRLPALCAQLP